jgi:hypothetical protein
LSSFFWMQNVEFRLAPHSLHSASEKKLLR